MGISRDAIERSFQVPNTLTRTSFRLSIRLSRLVLATSVRIAESATNSWSAGQEHIARRIAAEAPLATAKQGAHDIAIGLKKGDEELLELGEAAIVTALVKAAETPEVPDRVTKEVAALVEHQPVDPLTTPRISDDTAARAAALKNEFKPKE